MTFNSREKSHALGSYVGIKSLKVNVSIQCVSQVCGALYYEVSTPECLLPLLSEEGEYTIDGQNHFIL